MPKSCVSLKTLSTIRIGGTAELVFYPETRSEFLAVLKQYPQAPIIGGGSNVFFADRHFSAIIVTTKLDAQAQAADGPLTVDCGVRAAKLFDFMAGVPVTIGGALVMNFGAHNKEISQYVRDVSVVRDGQIVTLSKEQISWGYRTTSLQKNKEIIIGATLTGIDNVHAEEILEKRKIAMPWGLPNIGSIFKNPTGQSAGKLLDEAGVRGLRYGDVAVSEKHANIFVNLGNGTAEDMLQLIAEAKRRVFDKFNVELEQEVIYIA